MMEVLIFGAGGLARTTALYVEAAGARHVGYVVNQPTEHEVAGKPVWAWGEQPDVPIVIAIGNPDHRKAVVEMCRATDARFAGLVVPQAFIGRVELGEGVVIAPGCVLTADVRIGDHVYVNIGCSVGHDAVVGRYTSMGAGVNISGNVRIGEGVWIGSGATLIHGVTVGDRAVIGAGACVVTDVEPDSLYVGVPARLKKRYTPDAPRRVP